jgi:ribulose-phosphate 3-epimerase
MIDLCLCMSVDPGWGGQHYIPGSTARLAALRRLVPDDVVLEVDGGISLETIDEARDAGAQLFVAGSNIFGAEDVAEAYRALAARLA